MLTPRGLWATVRARVGSMLATSAEFCLASPQDAADCESVQFVSGLSLRREAGEDRLLLSCGVSDCEARLVALSLPHVLQSLHPLADDVERACAPEGGGRGVEVVAKWLRGAGTGYCRRANGGNCDSDDHGSIPLSVAETRTEWHAAAACLRKCRQCARCRHISVSVEFRECSWYSVW